MGCCKSKESTILFDSSFLACLITYTKTHNSFNRHEIKSMRRQKGIKDEREKMMTQVGEQKKLRLEDEWT